MAARMAARMAPPPRTPSPKIRIHRSQSFDSPSSRISVTPIDDSPYSKSTSAIVAKPLPRYDALHAAEHALLSRNHKLVLHTKMSNESMSDSSSLSSASSPSISPSSEQGDTYAFFSSGSPVVPSPPPPARRTGSNDVSVAPPHHVMSIYQDPSTSMYDPWLVRVVLDMFDLKGLDWMTIAEPIERIFGFRTSSGEVMGILSANGRVARLWWD